MILLGGPKYARFEVDRGDSDSVGPMGEAGFEPA